LAFPVAEEPPPQAQPGCPHLRRGPWRAGPEKEVPIPFLESDVWGGAYLRSLHRLSSHALLVLLALHTLRVILTGAFLHPKKMNWIYPFAGRCLLVNPLPRRYSLSSWQHIFPGKY
jgi:hypothetical protein